MIKLYKDGITVEVAFPNDAVWMKAAGYVEVKMEELKAEEPKAEKLKAEKPKEGEK